VKHTFQRTLWSGTWTAYDHDRSRLALQGWPLAWDGIECFFLSKETEETIENSSSAPYSELPSDEKMNVRKYTHLKADDFSTPVGDGAASCHSFFSSSIHTNLFVICCHICLG
jgi:hypothetical protein